MPVLSVEIPVIETERLVLREPRMADLPAFAAFAASDRARFVGGANPTPYAAWDGLRGMLGHWLLRGFGWWTAEDRATGATAGRLGIGHHIDWPEPELGWHLFDGFEGRGLAHEAALAVRRWWRGRGHPAPISLIDPGNARSIRLAERLGAVPEREITLRGAPCTIWRHPAEGTA